MNAGIRLQRDWRWNGRPLRIRIELRGDEHWAIVWQRWFAYGRRKGWEEWRTYVGRGTLQQTIREYRNYASYWRGHDF